MASWLGCGCVCSKDASQEQEITPQECVLEELPGLKPAELWDKTESPSRLPSTKSEEGKSPVSPRVSWTPEIEPATSNRSIQSSRSGAGGQSVSTEKSQWSMKANAGALVDCSTLPEDVRRVLEEAEVNRLSGSVFAAEKAVVDLIERLEAEGKGEILEKVKRTSEYLELVEQLEGVNKMLLQLLDDDGWTLQKEADRILVWTKPQPGTDLVTVRIAGVVEGSYDAFCSIGKEVDLIKTWMPGVKTSYILSQLTTFDHIAYYVWKFPFITAREFLLEEHSNINDEQGYIIASRQPPVPREGVDLPPLQKSVVRASFSDWSCFSAPCGKKSTFAISVVNVDMKIGLPTRLVNWLSISMGYQSMQDLRQNVQKCSDPTGPFPKALSAEESQRYYDRMRSLDKVREAKDIPCKDEILRTGWVKDPKEREKIFGRSSGVLVPIA